MKRLAFIITVGFIHILVSVVFALDQYPGDTSIYGVSAVETQPNILFIIDNSGSMNGETVVGDPYVSGTTYTVANACEGDNKPCDTNAVYRWVAFGVEGKWVKYINDVSSVSCTTAYTKLTTLGQFQGRLNQNGTCNIRQRRSYALGNYINWLEQSGGTSLKIDVAKNVITDLINITSGVKFGALRFNNNQGGNFITYNGYTTYIKDMDAIFSGSTTNREATIDAVDSLTADTWTPLAETLFEAMRYYSGGQSAFNGNITYTSPIEYSCQKNYIVIVTDGMSTQDINTVLTTDATFTGVCSSGDCDGDGFEPANDPDKLYTSSGSDYLDDVAHYLNNNDLRDTLAGTQNVITYTVGFGLSGSTASAVKLLQETASNGGGEYYTAGDYQALSKALQEIISIIIQDNTSFVAPVVPVSPENRTFSGSRVYLGFFKPLASAFWYGNLKKYGIDSSGNVVDKDGKYATYVDTDGDGLDDRDSLAIPVGSANGGFRQTSISYWSSIADGGEVDVGGAGAVLLDASWDFSTDPRNLYTYTGTNTTLTDISNAFTTSNTAITYSDLDVLNDTEKDKLINFIHGKDAYDSDSDGNTTEKSSWLLADILHSKPLVINYASYTFSATNEASCSTNKTIIYTGTNSGMLHAFRDCDGKEIWSFVPQNLLSNLKHLTGSTHTYYVDSSPTPYIYDNDGDGNIETADGDKAIIVFGERRGGDFYYALDVSDPSSPKYLWRLNASESPSGTNTDYSELGESWSEPVVAKVKLDVSGTETTKVVAFVGAGYDNVNEDTEPDTTNTIGRGVYAIEIATLDSNGVPSFTESGYKVWGYTNADNSSMVDSIPSQLSVVDIDGDGYSDRIYLGDTGGNIWRFDTTDTDTANWTGRMIFGSNPGADSSTGRKIFYRPSVTLEVGYEMLFFGTGDRAHPTATDKVDRLYAVKDTGQLSAKGEDDLSDATSGSVFVDTTDGWYVALSTNSGEKSLAQASVLSKVAYYTTYTPSTDSGSDPCVVIRGTARLYAVEYLTATAAYNYDTSNDSGGMVVLETSDRSTLIGTGIPSGVVMVISPSGVSALIGVGGAIVKPEVSESGSIIPTYWREVR